MDGIMMKLPWERQALMVKFDALRWANRGLVRLLVDGRQDAIEIGGHPAALAAALRQAAEAIEGMSVAEAGILRGEAEPQAVERFSLITMDDLNGDPEHDWPLMAERFPWMAKWIEPKFLKRSAGEVLQGRLDEDVLLVRKKLGKVIDFSSRGYQSRIAEALGITNAGQHNRRRIAAVVERLQQVA